MFDYHKIYKIYTSEHWYWIVRREDFWSGKRSSTTMEGSSSAANNTTRAGPSPVDKVDQSEQLNAFFFFCNEIVYILVVITSPFVFHNILE